MEQAETAREVLEQVRASPVVPTKPARQDGSNQTFSTPSATSCVGVGIRGWWMRCWIPPGGLSGFLRRLPGPKDGAGLILRGTQKRLAQWAEAVHQVYTEAKASVLPRAQPGHRTHNAGGETNGLGAAFPSPGGSGRSAGAWNGSKEPVRTQPCPQTTTPPSTSGPARSAAAPAQGRAPTARTLASLFGTWRARGSPPGMPPVAHFPSTLTGL